MVFEKLSRCSASIRDKSKNTGQLFLKKCWCHALYLSDKSANNHESRFNLFGLIN